MLLGLEKRYKCPECGAMPYKDCEGGKIHRLRLNKASGNPKVIRQTARSMMSGGDSRGVRALANKC